MAVFDVSSTVKLNIPMLKRLDTTSVKALVMTTDALLTEVKNAMVMPFDTGNMQKENTFADYSYSKSGVTSIVSSTLYARRLYYHPEYNFQTDYNSFAGGKWFEPWLKGGKQEHFAEKAFAKIYKGLNGL